MQLLTLFFVWINTKWNNELWKCTKQPRIDLQIRKCKWGWMGHTMRKPMDDITRQALQWNPQGKRSRGRPKNTWRRTVLEEAKGVKKAWAEIKCGGGILWMSYVLQWNDATMELKHKMTVIPHPPCSPDFSCVTSCFPKLQHSIKPQERRNITNSRATMKDKLADIQITHFTKCSKWWCHHPAQRLL